MNVGQYRQILLLSQICLMPGLECDSKAPAYSKFQSSGSALLSSPSAELCQCSQSFPFVQS